MSDFQLLGGILACGVTGGVGCAVFGAQMALFNAFVALQSGASLGQIALNIGIGIGAGMLTSGIISAVAGPALNPVWSIISGSASAALSTAIGDVLGHRKLGWDVFVAAAVSAAQGAATLSLQGVAPLTQEGGQDATPQPRSVRTPVNACRISVLDESGGVTGYLDYTYQIRSDAAGVVLSVYYSSIDGDGNLNWVQTVTTTTTTNGAYGFFQFNDNGNGDGTGYAMSPAQANSIPQKSDYDAYWTDAPNRLIRGGVGVYPNVNWSAETSLVSTTNSTILITLTWGFSTNATGQVSIAPLTVSEPTPFQLDTISAARAGPQ